MHTKSWGRFNLSSFIKKITLCECSFLRTGTNRPGPPSIPFLPTRLGWQCRPIKTGPVLQRLPLSWSFNYANEFLASNCTLQMFTGIYGVPIGFFLQYLWKRAVRITKKPYTPQRERLCMLWGNPVIFADFGENPMTTIGSIRK